MLSSALLLFLALSALERLLGRSEFGTGSMLGFALAFLVFLVAGGFAR